jgi:exodeoxyribonuclease VII large subunit
MRMVGLVSGGGVNRPLYAQQNFGKSYAVFAILVSMEDSGQSDALAAAITVSQLNRQVKTLIEQGTGRVWVQAEISNIARPASGHLYFSLKDDSAQIRAAYFRQRQRGPTIGLKNGDQVLALGRVSLYEARGDYQLIVEQVEPAGEGALKRHFEVLKKKLSAEGLFDEDRKKPLPNVPQRIGVITSPSGAALRDILSVLGRRFPSVPVIVYPTAVQGDAAAPELITALETANRRDECDVLIISRGGGSLEDLWAFNDETLARAIAASPIPIVSAVGHEIDFTIADFVADVRAPTPSGAAELVVPDQDDWLRNINVLAVRVARLGQRAVEDRSQKLDWLSRRLVHSSPVAAVGRQSAMLREMRMRMAAAIRQSVALPNRQLQLAHGQLISSSPAIAVQRSITRLGQLQQRLNASGQNVVSSAKHRLELSMRSLHSVSPLATLQRGYAIVEDAATGRVLTQTDSVSPGDDIRARLAHGKIVATVKSVTEND